MNRTGNSAPNDKTDNGVEEGHNKVHKRKNKKTNGSIFKQSSE